MRFWRNKRGAEVDFVLPRRGDRGPIAIECKWSAGSFDPAGLRAFRRLYPEGPSFVVAADVDTSHTRTRAGLEISYVSLEQLIARLSREPLGAR